MPTLTIAWFPPVEYFALLAKYSSVYVEACENYQKQSYRNRCRIYAADGVLNTTNSRWRNDLLDSGDNARFYLLLEDAPLPTVIVIK